MKRERSGKRGARARSGASETLAPTPSGSPASGVKAYARQLVELYHDALRSAMLGMNLGRAYQGVNFEKSWDTLDGTARRAFRRAAEAAMQVGADPREYVVAQFQRWAEVSQLKNRVLLPMPQHLGSLGAQARYVQYKLRKEERKARDHSRMQTELRNFYREERKLQGMTKLLRCMPEDVLAEKPEEFTREFLEHKQVWPLVQERWFERNA